MVDSYQGIEVYAAPQRRFTWGLGYHQFRNKSEYGVCLGTDALRIWTVGLGYQFTPTLRLQAAYAKEVAGSTAGPQSTGGDYDMAAWMYAGSVELDYKLADPLKKGSFGLFAAYRHLGEYAALAPTYDAVRRGNQGWEIGGQYVFAKNVVGTLKYFRGKFLNSNDTKYKAEAASTIFGRLEFFF